MRQLAFFKLAKAISGYIRGTQVAERMGAKLNPPDGYENDVCIFVKWTPCISKWGVLYYDFIDKHRGVGMCQEHPEYNVIAISKTAHEYLSTVLKNKIITIPQHHCNFERIQRVKREIKSVGFCGEYHTFAPFEQEIRERLSKIGMELKFYAFYKNRQDVINFYKDIDIQIVWRVEPGYIKPLKNPLKLSNAGSFGIPTVAYPEPAFVAEYNNLFLPANNMDQLIDAVNDLKNETLYNNMAERARIRSEDYHIDNIIKLYQKLGEE